MTDAPVSLLVLAAGSSRRWGGRDKTAVLLPDGEPLLAHVVRRAWDCLGAVPTVVVAPSGHPARTRLAATVAWLLEEPPGGGPSAGLAAGLAAVDTTWVAVLAADLPQAGPALARIAAVVTDVVAADGHLDGAIGVDPQGRRQHLLAVIDRDRLRQALARAAATGDGDVAGVSVRSVLQQLRLVEVAVGADEAFDLDTPDDLATWLHGPDPFRRKVNER